MIKFGPLEVIFFNISKYKDPYGHEHDIAFETR